MQQLHIDSGIRKIITGGQTGSDRAAMDFALRYGLPLEGWCPRGRLAEDGVIDSRYPLRETPSDVYAERTEWNVRDSDGTLVFTHGEVLGGTLLTIECTAKYARPTFVHELSTSVDRPAFDEWLRAHGIHSLNVAGPRESHAPGVVYRLTMECLQALCCRPV